MSVRMDMQSNWFVCMHILYVHYMFFLSGIKEDIHSEQLYIHLQPQSHSRSNARALSITILTVIAAAAKCALCMVYSTVHTMLSSSALNKKWLTLLHIITRPRRGGVHTNTHKHSNHRAIGRLCVV